MKRILALLLLTMLLPNFSFGQDDYVIEKPIEKRKLLADSLPNPDFTNYFINSSALTLNKGSIRLSNSYILYTKGSYGLTDNSTVSASLSLVGTYIGSFKQQISLTDELTLGFSGSIGQLAALPTDSTVYFAGAQSMVTLGDIQNNITFGISYYYAKSTFDLLAEERSLFLSNFYIAGQKQIGKRVYLIAEGMFLGSYNLLSGSIGTKIIIKRNMTLGIGVIPIAQRQQGIRSSRLEAGGLPYISFRMLFD
jgi:hypothetical protein